MDFITAVIVVCAVGGLVWASTETITNIAILLNTRPMRRKLDKLVPEGQEKPIEQMVREGISTAIKELDIKDIVTTAVTQVNVGDMLAGGIIRYIDIIETDKRQADKFLALIVTASQTGMQVAIPMIEEHLAKGVKLTGADG
ncbi:unnamed protein product, partial [marine sediment metagenome]